VGYEREDLGDEALLDAGVLGGRSGMVLELSLEDWRAY